jgi:hypothetical protein
MGKRYLTVSYRELIHTAHDTVPALEEHYDEAHTSGKKLCLHIPYFGAPDDLFVVPVFIVPLLKIPDLVIQRGYTGYKILRDVEGTLWESALRPPVDYLDCIKQCVQGG